jgi:RHS repeat-associated protein
LTQTLGVDSRNQLTNGSRSGTLTVSGTTSGTATNVTVQDNGNSPAQPATLYLDGTFARAGITMASGNNTFIATAKDANNRTDTTTTTVSLPTSETFTYDQNGNLTADGKRSFEYDAENQLTNVFEATKWKSEFRYDGQMRLRVRREFTWGSGAWVQTNECRYVYDGYLVIQERDGQNVPTVSYTRGKDLSGSRSGAGGIGGLLARTDNATQLHACYHADGNGNVTYMGNASQRLQAKYVYDPYGNLISAAGALAEANVYRFSSKESHAKSGLIYYLYRFYDPSLQRWVNRDPIEEQGGINLYGAGGNNLVKNVDPFGLSPGLSIVRVLPSIRSVTPRIPVLPPWLNMNEVSPIRPPESCGRKKDTSLDDCLDRCEKEAAARNWGAKQKNNCYCVCRTQYPPTKREKSSEKLKREWEDKHNDEWPENAVVHHINPLADGGEDNVDNIVPVDPVTHYEYHKKEGDFTRWGKRRGRGCK